MAGQDRLRVEAFAGSAFFQWPATWPSRKKIGLWATAVCSSLAAAALCAGAGAALARHNLQTALALGEWGAGLAMVGLLLVVGACANRRGHFSAPLRVDDPELGEGIATRLRTWPRILLVPLMALLAVGVLQGRLVLESGRKALPALAVDGLAALFAFSAAYLLVILLPPTSRRQGVALFPRAVALGYGLTVHVVPWEAIGEIVADERAGGRGQTFKQLMFRLRPEAQSTSTRFLPGLRRTRAVHKSERGFLVDYIETDPALLLHLCDFYLRNPGLRHELGSGAALARAMGAAGPGPGGPAGLS